MRGQRVDARDQFRCTVAAHRHGFHHRHAQRLFQRGHVDGNTTAARGVHHVQGDDHRLAQLAHFQRETQVQAQVGGVDHADQRIRRGFARIEATAQVAGDGLVEACRVQAVRAGQIQHRVLAS